MKNLNDIIVKGEKITPILKCVWENMPSQLKQVMGKEDPIFEISAKAEAVRLKKKELVRAESGQIRGILPELETYYSPPIGKVELRTLLAEFWSKFYNLKDITYENIAITNGASQGLSLLMEMLVYKQKVILNVPYWPNTPDIITRTGGKYIEFELVDTKGKLRLSELSKLVKKENAHIMFINFPNNPSGIALDKQQMTDLAEFSRKHNLIIISDEVYNRIRFKGTPSTMLSFAPERTVSVCSASKEYLIPGARIGYVISASKTITNVFFKQLVRIDSSCVSTIGQDIILPIIKKETEELKNNKPLSFLPPVLKELKQRRDALGKQLKETGFEIAGGLPDGSIFMFAKIPETLKISDTKFIEKAIQMGKISGIPGSECGKPGWIRFCFGFVKSEDIDRFGKNLKDVVKAVK
ncbi:MAG: pyridoxal phosphate-dependent aminotransferase [bacterium]|nr:pyridoxal phosphate-dependent aminotransferase [bacterium]